MDSRSIIGGPLDTAALTALGAAAMSAHPVATPIVPSAIALAMAAGGAGWMGWRAADSIRRQWAFQKTHMNVRSDVPRIPKQIGEQVDDAFLMGYCLDTGAPIWIPDSDLMRHVYIRGQSGVGKTVLASSLMFQQIQRGGGVLFVDGKIDADNIDQIYQMAAWAGRENDVEIISPGTPKNSNTYNPILYGDADEVAARIIGLIPSTEGNAGTDYYKQAANQGITTVINALKRAGLAYSFMDLTILLSSAKALSYLENKVPQGSDEAGALSIFLDQYRTGKDGMVDMKRLKETFGGIGGRLFTFGSGMFGDVMNTYDPEVRLYDSIRNNKITYVALPTMGKDVAASNFGKMLVGDFRTAVSWIQALPKEERPNPPYLAFFDEAGSYISATWDRIFEQARSAQIILMPAVQTNSNFEAVSPELAEMIEGNTWNKVFFKLGAQRTAEAAAEFCGMKKDVARTITRSDSESESAAMTAPSPTQSAGDSSGSGYSEREEEVYRVTPDDFKSLDKGEAVVVVGGDRIYPIKVPMILLDDEFTRRIGRAKTSHRKRRFNKGINLFSQRDRFLTTKEAEAMKEGSGDAPSSSGKGGKKGGGMLNAGTLRAIAQSGEDDGWQN